MNEHPSGSLEVRLTAKRAGSAAMNILVCTPGRLLQHMDETPGFEASGLQMLVLDEADRILDMASPLACTAVWLP